MFSVIELARRVLLFLRRKNLDSGFYARVRVYGRKVRLSN